MQNPGNYTMRLIVSARMHAVYKLKNYPINNFYLYRFLTKNSINQ
jgi:hypothetical protein